MKWCLVHKGRKRSGIISIWYTGKYCMGGDRDRESLLHALRYRERVRNFSWFLLKGKLLTNSERCRRKMANDDNCIISKGAPEDIDHVFRLCPLYRRKYGEGFSHKASLKRTKLHGIIMCLLYRQKACRGHP